MGNELQVSEKQLTIETQQFDLLLRKANMLSKSKIVPKVYQNNVADCAIASELAQRMGLNEMMVMQNLHIINGNPSFSAKFLIATINMSGKFSSLDYERVGDGPEDKNYKVRAFAKDLCTGKELIGEWITWAMVKGEGWDSKQGSKWKNIPGQMFLYRAAAFWQRAYCPEISMGFMTTEEVEDFSQVVERVDRKPDDPEKTEGGKLPSFRPVKSCKKAAPKKPEPVVVESHTQEDNQTSAEPSRPIDAEPPDGAHWEDGMLVDDETGEIVEGLWGDEA